MSKEGYYDGKPSDMPRLVYRNLLASLNEQDTPEQRTVVIYSFLESLKKSHGSGEFLKMKMTLPEALCNALSSTELDVIEAELAKLRAVRGSRLHSVFPVCSDEFKFSQDFYSSVFRGEPDPAFNRSSQIFTIGSCFAVNISRYLSKKGYNIEAFRKSETVNSIFGNALLFAVLCEDDATIHDFIHQSLSSLFPSDVTEAQFDNEITQLKNVKDRLISSDVLIVTLGNTVDAFYESTTAKFSCPKVFPRFLNALQDTSVKGQSKISAALQSRGGTFKLAGVSDTLPVLKQMFSSLRSLNPSAKIFTTVSPVAIHNAMGISDYLKRGPIEADCATKSILRACIEDVLVSNSVENLSYFPSFEIVRWLGSTIGKAAYGQEDASSTHVSDEVLSSIYDYFEHLYAEK